ncbi:MAG TPA: replication-associated recombination protein A [Bacillota bacterium]|jgi:putative ATPase|nr:replication-associated recombination protein A [Bacillota bacterium]
MMPLSTMMRPEKLDEFVGQDHFMYDGSLFCNAIKNKTFESAIFFGPSGTGKTTLARLIAQEMDLDFFEINASTTGIKELKEILEKAKVKFFGLQKQKTYLYVDEFHRWNKLQQDSLLKALEEGVVRFIGSTTENPYFSVNNAILSRVRSIYEFKKLSTDDIVKILHNTLDNKERGLGNHSLVWQEEALHALADLSGGDARIALDTLGFIADNIKYGQTIDMQIVGEATQRQMTFYDRKEDKYNLLSALQKSIRGSDPDASLHYLARLIDGGADVVTIGRRLLVISCEDVGMAYPQAVSIVTSCVQASQMVGLPEARINLAQAVILLSVCPKSNSVISAIDRASEDLRTKNIDDVPLHLKDNNYSGAKNRGIGIGYKYPHAYGGYVKQQYLPDSLYNAGVKYYEPTENGKELSFKKFLESIRGFCNED